MIWVKYTEQRGCVCVSPKGSYGLKGGITCKNNFHDSIQCIDYHLYEGWGPMRMWLYLARFNLSEELSFFDIFSASG